MGKFTAAFMLFTLIFFSVGCSDGSKKSKQNTPPPAKVAVINASSSDIAISFSYPAKITSVQDVDIVAKVSGTIIKQYAKAGEIVKEGDELFLIDPLKYEAAVQIAQANLEVALAQLNRANLNYKRAQNLKASQAISQKEYDEAVATYKVSKANVQSAQANLNSASIDLGYTKVKAPFSGRLGDAYKDVGEYLGGGDLRLIRLTRLNPIQAVFSIPDIEALSIDKNLQSKNWEQISTQASLKTQNGEYNGTVVFIDKVINEKTGSLDAKAEFINSDEALLPGGYGLITMGGFYQKNGFLIPQILIQQDISGPYVLLLKDGKIAKQKIEIIHQTTTHAVVSKGLKNADKIVADNFKKIRVGVVAVEAKGGF